MYLNSCAYCIEHLDDHKIGYFPQKDCQCTNIDFVQKQLKIKILKIKEFLPLFCYKMNFYRKKYSKTITWHWNSIFNLTSAYYYPPGVENDWKRAEMPKNPFSLNYIGKDHFLNYRHPLKPLYLWSNKVAWLNFFSSEP